MNMNEHNGKQCVYGERERRGNERTKKTNEIK